MREKRILVTGGYGFIGSSLVKHLVEICSPTSIAILNNFSAGTPDDLAEVTSYVLSSPSECSAPEGVVRSIISNALDGREISMKIVHGVPRLGDVKRNYADTRKAEKMLGWRAQMSIETGY